MSLNFLTSDWQRNATRGAALVVVFISLFRLSAAK
jgi:hypothetical protein